MSYTSYNCGWAIPQNSRRTHTEPTHTYTQILNNASIKGLFSRWASSCSKLGVIQLRVHDARPCRFPTRHTHCPPMTHRGPRWLLGREVEGAAGSACDAKTLCAYVRDTPVASSTTRRMSLGANVSGVTGSVPGYTLCTPACGVDCWRGRCACACVCGRVWLLDV